METANFMIYQMEKPKERSCENCGSKDLIMDPEVYFDQQEDVNYCLIKCLSCGAEIRTDF